MSVRRLVGVALAGAAVSGWGVPADAVTPFDAVASSPDVTVALSSAVADDDDVAEDDLSTVTAPLGPPDVPVGADLTGYHRDGSDELFAVDTTIPLPGGLTVTPADVARWNGATYTIEFSGASEGVPTGAAVDAVSLHPITGDLVLSFDIDVQLGSLVVADEDLVAFDGSGFSSYFDGSAAGVPDGLDVDAAHVLGGFTLVLSFDASGEVGGVVFDDEDVLEYTLLGPGTWELSFDGSAGHAAWTEADLDGLHLVPEPGHLVSLAAGLALLAGIQRRRTSIE